MPRIKGLKDISFAKLLTDVAGKEATYDTVKKYERSVTAKITPKSESETEYSDDNVEEVVNQFSQIDVEIELNMISTQTRAFLQGSKVVNGILIESKDDVAPYVAMIFKAKKSNGKYRYVCLYKGKFELSEDNYETEADKIKTQTASLKATFMAREFDGNYRLMADEDTEDIVAADLEKWFTAVPTVPIETTSEA
ncbi:major tail protein [Clostridium sp. BL-8]|uniref:major tail protein n=1 Tax=Clostridium sp. BL-8 TaxID=349938 RepID=UPI00098C9EFC|nr:major tail protein [Clostridium sp. BL-8]OOM75500.1 phage major tail protein [Clostridium sp. BL-8]